MTEKNSIKNNKRTTWACALPDVSTKWMYDKDGLLTSWFDEKWNFSPVDYDPSAKHTSKWRTFSLKSNPEHKIEDPFDLNNLRFFSPNQVQEALDDINYITLNNAKKEIVCMIWTWWTIASFLDEDWKVKPWLSIPYLLEYSGWWLQKRFTLTCVQFPTLIPSSQMEIDYMADIVIVMSYIFKNITHEAKELFAWFMVTHWTDTLSLSATYVNAMLWANYPFSVAFVWSQKTIDDQFTDVGINFSFWLHMLSKLRLARKYMVFVCMWWHAGWAYIPAATIKISDTEANAFGSPWRKKIMDSSDFISHWINTNFYDYKERERTVEDTFQPIIFRWYVPLSTITAKVWADPDKLYTYVKNLNELAIILVTYWSFSFNYKQINAIMKAAKENNTIVMAVNPFPNWKTDHLYEETYFLIESWIIPIHSLEHAVYAKVKWAQTVFWNDLNKIRMFLTWCNFMWEQPDDWDQPLDVLQEWMRLNWYKMRKFWQPIESLNKII